MKDGKPERVQFFQLGDGKDIQPVWVFRQTTPGTVLGLLIAIGDEGAQVLTERSNDLAGNAYRLMIFGGEKPSDELLSLNARCVWSKPHGTLYVHNDLAFDKPIAVQKVLELLHTGSGYLRCELLRLTEEHDLPTDNT